LARLARVGELRRPPPVLILGDAGTGRAQAAREIHRTGPRSAGPFVSVNVGELPEALVEVELLGCAPGCFCHGGGFAGACERAHGGILLLEDVARLEEVCWIKLAHVLQTGTVLRLGSSTREPADIWLVLTAGASTTIGERPLTDVLTPFGPIVLTVPSAGR
jgi:DNA-binding NtrC family response regulator